MDLMEKALIRKQIADLTCMARELKKDLKIVQDELIKVEKLLAKKEYRLNKKLKNFQKVYKQNKTEIEQTLKTAHDLINQLQLQSKPRSYIQVTKKLV